MGSNSGGYADCSFLAPDSWIRDYFALIIMPAFMLDRSNSESLRRLVEGVEEHLKNCKHFTAALGGVGNVVRLAGDAAASDSRTGHNSRLEQKPSRRQEQAQRRTNKRTFYVDDNPKALRILTFALEWSGYKVVTACNAQALERMKQISADLVLLAYRTPQ
jgi:hypothetical protein